MWHITNRNTDSKTVTKEKPNTIVSLRYANTEQHLDEHQQLFC